MRIFFLTFSDIIQIHEDAILDSGGGTGLRDKAGIESAVAAPQASYFGQEQYPGIAAKAAIVCFELVTQHPFIDGNKRVGHGAMVHFLYINGYILDAEDDEQEQIILKLASGNLEKEPFAKWVESKLAPIQ